MGRCLSLPTPKAGTACNNSTGSHFKHVKQKKTASCSFRFWPCTRQFQVCLNSFKSMPNKWVERANIHIKCSCSLRHARVDSWTRTCTMWVLLYSKVVSRMHSTNFTRKQINSKASLCICVYSMQCSTRAYTFLTNMLV